MGGKFRNVYSSVMKSQASTCRSYVNKTEYVTLKNNLIDTKGWIDDRKNQILNYFVPNESYYDQLIELLNGINTLADYIEQYNNCDDRIDDIREEISRCRDYSEIQSLREEIETIKEEQNELYVTIVNYCNAASYELVDRPIDYTSVNNLIFKDDVINGFYSTFGDIKKRFIYLMNSFANSSALGRSSNLYVSRYMNRIKSLLNEMNFEYKAITEVWSQFNDDLKSAHVSMATMVDNLDIDSYSDYTIYDSEEDHSYETQYEEMDPETVYATILDEDDKSSQEKEDSTVDVDAKVGEDYVSQDKSDATATATATIVDSTTKTVDYTTDRKNADSTTPSEVSAATATANITYNNTNKEAQDSKPANTTVSDVTVTASTDYVKEEIPEANTSKVSDTPTIKVVDDYRKTEFEEVNTAVDSITAKTVDDISSHKSQIEDL